MRSQPIQHCGISLVLSLGLSACARPSTGGSTGGVDAADPSSVVDPEATAEDAPRPDEPPAAIDGAPTASAANPCVEQELNACVEACWTRTGGSACLEWCAGPGCTKLLTEAYTCIAPTLEKFEADTPRPAECDCTQRDCFEPASREEAWNTARQDTLERVWDEACAAACTAPLSASPAAEPSFCAPNDFQVSKWESLTKPVAPHGVSGMLGAGPIAGAMGSIMMVSGVSLDDEARYAVLYPAVVDDILSSDMRALEGCVPKGKDSLDVEATLVFGDDGGVREVELAKASKVGSCLVGAITKSDMGLPTTVVADLPRAGVTIHLRPMRMEEAHGLVGTDTMGTVLRSAPSGGTGRGGTGEGSLGSPGQKRAQPPSR